MSVKLANFVSCFNNALKLNLENFTVPFSTFNIRLARVLKLEGIISSIIVYDETSIALGLCFTERGTTVSKITLLNKFGRVAKLRYFETLKLYKIGAPGFVVLSNLSGLAVSTPGSYSSKQLGGRPIVFVQY